jgi:hypothetical protein
VVAQVKPIIEEKIQQLVPLINRILDLFPNRIDIPGTLMHLDIGYSSNIQCKEQSHLTLPLSVTLQSDLYPFLANSTAEFPEYSDRGYEIELAISQFFVNNFLYELHKNGLIIIDTNWLLGEGYLTVGGVKGKTGGNYTGFNDSAPCKIMMQSLDPYPQFQLQAALSKFVSNFSMALYCKHENDTADNYTYMLTYDTEVDFTADVYVEEPGPNQVRLMLKLKSIYIHVMDVIDTAIGPVGYFYINLFLSTACLALPLIINTYLSNGFDLNWIVQDALGLSFFYFKRMVLEEENELIYARLTPGFNITWANNGTETTTTQPRNLDLSGLSGYINGMGLPRDLSEQGIERFVNEKLAKAM